MSADFDREAIKRIGSELRPGGRRRVNHDCGGGKTLLVSRDPGYVNAWCFRCGEGTSVALTLNIRENLERARMAQALDDSYNGGPPPHPLLPWREWPSEARVWLLKAGLGWAHAMKFGFGWHEETRRVVFPIHGINGGETWSARDLDGGRPKYLTGLVPQGFVAGFNGEGPPIVVEDYLSTLKMHLAGLHVVSLIGTIPTDAALLYLAQHKEVITWLDPDKPGQDKAGTLRRRLRAAGVNTRNVLSSRDPKLHTRAELHSYVAHSAAIHTT